MVCKKDVVTWFKGLKSYKRADVMCSLLNLCLPFELRFLGTCLEHLGKRDFHDLRQAENEANNQAELSSPDLQSLSNNQARTKLALYVSLLHSCNYACSNIIYKILSKNEDIANIYKASGDEQILDELLLIFTLALNHPAFSFEQKHALEKSFNQLIEEEQKLYEQNINRNKINYGGPGSHENVLDNKPPPPPLQYPFLQGYPQCIGIDETQIIGVPSPAPCPPIPAGGPPIPGSIGVPMSCPCTIRDGMGLAFPGGPAPGAPVIVNPAGWPTIIATSETSPLVSRTSSPCQSNSASRPGSPGKLKFPPPRVPPPDNREAVGKDVFPTYSQEQLFRMSDDELREIGMQPGAIMQLRALQNKQVPTNGVGPGVLDFVCKKKGDDKQVTKRLVQELVTGMEGMSMCNFGGIVYPPINNGCFACYPGPRKSQRPSPISSVRRLPLDQDNQLRWEGDPGVYISNSSASDTASDHSPPDTPGPPQPPAPGMVLGPSGEMPPGVEERLGNIQTGEDRRGLPGQGRARGPGRHRSNPPGMQSLPRGRGPNPAHRRREVSSTVSNGSGNGGSNSSGSNGSGNGGSGGMDERKVYPGESPAFYSQTGQFVQQHFVRPAYRTYSGYVRHAYPFHPNGDIVYQYPPPPPPNAGPQPFLPPPQYTAAAAAPPIIPPPKVSCYNCGSQSHIAVDCPEATIEEVAKQGQYRIDFAPAGYNQKPGSGGNGTNEVQPPSDK